MRRARYTDRAGEIVATFVPLTGRDEILYEVIVDAADLPFAP